LRYKFKVYQKNFPDFVYGSPTSTEASNKDEEAETRLSGIVQEEEVQNEEPQNFKQETI
jgi:hypothetical protein